MSFQQYSNYVESNSLWLPEHPTHWKVVPLGSLISRRKLKNRSDLPLLSVLREKGVVPRALLSSDENHNYIPDDLSNYRVALNGDLVVNKMKAWQGSVGIAPIDGIVSPAYFVFSIKGVTKGYAHRLLRSRLYADYFARASDGVRIGQWDLSIDQMKRIPVLLPPNQEQDQIVAYLRAQDAQIARFIKTKRDLIKLLTEQKLCIIDHAVARGLDASVALKQSGIEWLGEVPEHWEVKPLKRWVRLNARTLGQKTNPDFEFRYVDIGSVQTGRLVKELERIRFEAAPSRARRVLRRGDTIISTVRTYLKAIWYVGEDADDLIASTGFAVLTPGKNVETEYLGYVIQSSAFVNRVAANSIGIAYPAIAETVLGRFPVALPPTVDEQQAIVAHIKTESAPLDDAIARTEEEIKLIREYRDRLIADVVTGQVDVRGWQPGPDDVVDDAALVALGDENEDVTEEEDGDGED